MRRAVSLVGFFAVSVAAPGWAQQASSTQQNPLPPHPAVLPLSQPLVGPPTLVNSHIVYLNNCRPNGCKVTQGGSDDARIDQSAIVPHSGTLTALKSTVDWNAVKACVTTAMAPFNVTVTDTDPGTVPHFEIMIAGSPTDVGFDSSFEGVAQYLCSGSPGSCSGTYIPEALSFAFGNASTLGGSTTNICGVALQETAHGWTLDHATPTSDPMTYNTYTTPLAFRDNAPCGSDCYYANGTQNAFGVVCSGTGNAGTHACMENGMATQNEVTILKNLFGPAGAALPTVMITSPSNGQGEQMGQAFNVTATCTAADGVKEIDFLIDGQQMGMAASSPATFMAPNYLLKGAHQIDVICGTTKFASATASVTVMVGDVCATDADCGTNKICYQSSCIAGPGGAGGLGATCTQNSDCASGSCGDDGNQKLCVVPCDPNNDMCPSGFGCLADASGGGVCWLGGGGSSGGCCETGRGDSRGSILLGLAFAAALVTRRRK